MALALALLLVGMAAVATGLAVLLRAQEAVKEGPSFEAVAGAEAGAMQAIAEAEAGLLPPGQPVRVCRSGTDLGGASCTPASPDYVGCYTYRGSRFTGPGSLADCPPPESPGAPGFAECPAGATRVAYGLAIVYRTGPGGVRQARAQVKACYDGIAGAFLSVEVVR